MPETLPRQAGPILDLISQANRIVLTTHHKPDGDAIGSLLGMYLLLQKMGHEAQAIVPSACPSFLEWLPATDALLNAEDHPDEAQAKIAGSDLLVALDYSQWERTRHLQETLDCFTGPTVVIDHHRNPAGVFSCSYWDDTACATCQLVFEWLMEVHGAAYLDDDIATLLYTGIVTDSGGFRFASVTPATHHAAGALVERGARPEIIQSQIFERNRVQRLRFWGYSLDRRMTLMDDLPVAYMILSEADIRRYGLVEGDTEGLVNEPLTIEGIQLSATLREDAEEGVVKISMRSKGQLPVNELSSRYFTGGGHKNAAGGRLSAPLAEAEARFLEAVRAFMQTEWSTDHSPS